MKIEPPSRAGGGIQELPEEDGVGPLRPTGAASASGRIEGATASAGRSGVNRIESLETTELRSILGDLDRDDPHRLETATHRMVDWVLRDTFGPEVLDGPRGEAFREAVRAQLLGDPSQSARIQRILDRIAST